MFKDLVHVAIAACIVGVMVMLVGVLKEVAESGPVVQKAVSQFVGDNNSAAQ